MSGSWARASSHGLPAGNRSVALGTILRRAVRPLALREEAGVRLMLEALREMMSVIWMRFSRSLRDIYSSTGVCHKGMTSGNCTPLEEGETGDEIMFFVTRRCLTFLKDDVDMALSCGAIDITICMCHKVDSKINPMQ